MIYLYIDDINELSKATTRTKVQVLKALDDEIQLTLNADNINIVTDITEIFGDTAYSNMVYHQTEGYALGTTDTYHDSITGLADEILDGLNLITASKNNTNRYFIFNSDNTYTVITDLEDAAGGNLNIEGKTSGSIIDADGHSMFNLAEPTTLSIANT